MKVFLNKKKKKATTWATIIYMKKLSLKMKSKRWLSIEKIAIQEKMHHYNCVQNKSYSFSDMYQTFFVWKVVSPNNYNKSFLFRKLGFFGLL